MNRTEYKKASERYIRSLATLNKSKDTIDKYSFVLREFYAQTTGEINREAVEQWRDAKAEHVKSGTVNHYLTVLQTFFAWCNERGICDELTVDKPKAEQREYTLLDETDIETILNAKKPKPNQKNACKARAIVITLLQTGIRSGELRALKPGDLDFESKTITIKHGKGDKRRIVPFPKASREAIIDYLKTRPADISPDMPLFVNNAEQQFGGKAGGEYHAYTKAGLNALVARYVYKLTGKQIHCHTLRHSAAAYWDNNDVPIRAVQQALGHKSIHTTESVYLYVLNKTKAAEQINKLIDERKEQ